MAAVQGCVHSCSAETWLRYGRLAVVWTYLFKLLGFILIGAFQEVEQDDVTEHGALEDTEK